MLSFGQILVHIQVNCRGHLFGFTHVLELNRLMTEQFLAHIRNLELSAGCSPLTCVLAAFVDDALLVILCDIHCIVHQANTVIGGLMLENITILTTILVYKVENIIRDIRNLNRVCLDVGNNESTLLDLTFQRLHEQRAALGHNIIVVTWVAEWIAELRGRQPVHRVNDNFQRVSQVIPSIIGSTGHNSLCERNQFAIQQFLQSFNVLVLNVHTSVLQVLEVFCVFAKVLFSNQTRRMHRSNIIQTDVAVHTGFCIDITAFADFLDDVIMFFRNIILGNFFNEV